MFLSWNKGRSACAPRRSPRAETRLRLEALEDRAVPATAFLATDLVSDQPGVAPITDPTLVNAWGIALNPAGPVWISANGTGLSEVYGGPVSTGALTQPFKVNTPGGSPTGQVFAGIAGNFVVSGVNASGNPTSGQSAFIFASESGNVTGWNPAVFAAAPTAPGPSTNAILGFSATDGAIYKGIALANNGTANFLYVADFHNGKIDVLDTNFHLTHLNGSFTDPNLPRGYAPFNVAAINGKLYVTYAKQDADAEDDVAGRGNGFIDVFDTNGHLQQRLASRGELNSPWGMALAPAGFGDFGGALLVGNFGNGHINAFNPDTGKFLGTLSEAPGRPLTIDGLWGLAFGNGTPSGDANTLFYAAGPDGEAHGLFGKITANPAGTNPVHAALAGSTLVVTGSRDSDVIIVGLEDHGQKLVVRAGGEKIGSFDLASVGNIHVTGLAGNDVIVIDPRVHLPAVLEGGAGNDILAGGGGRDLLIGGDGRDLLFGAGNDDILVSGRTASDGKEADLLKILSAWNSTDSYAVRVANIRSGANGVPKLDSSTVFDDGVRDDLFGGSGLDWFLATLPDVLHGRLAAEQIN